MSEVEIESEEDPRRIGSYKPFSALALVGLILAIVSGLNVLNPAMVILPITALVVSLVASLKVGLSRVPMGGGWVALFALFLSAFFLIAGNIYTQLRKEQMFRLARQFTDQWFELIRDGEIYRPHHLMRDYTKRQPPTVDLKDYYSNLTFLSNEFGDNSQTIPNHEKLEPEKSIREFGRKMTCDFVGNHYYQTTTRKEYFTLNYVLNWPPESGRKPWPIMVMVERINHKPPWGPHWTVIDIYPSRENPMFERRRIEFRVQ